MGYDRYRAKKTYYAGEWYDSNLEARVAEALDDIGVAHEHHRQCFRDRRFPYGQYTPDFHLPNTGQYVEVCAVLDERHRGNLATLADVLGEGAVLVVMGDGSTYAWGGGGAGPWAWEAAGRRTTNLFEAAVAARG